MNTIFTNRQFFNKPAITLLTGLLLLLISTAAMSQATPPDPTSNSPQCIAAGVTITANGTAPTGESWYWQATANGTSTSNNATSSQTVFTSGTYYIRALNNTTFTWSAGSGSVSVTVSPDVTAPVFVLGTTSTRCQGADTVTYTANASNTTGITYSLDATSLSYGNTINATTGEVIFASNWNGSSTITASAAGCNGPLTSNHVVDITPTVSTPVFDLGVASTRCQGAGTVNYNATANNYTSLTYSLDSTSLAEGNSINTATGDVTYNSGWSGTSLITVTAEGCNGPKTATHTITTFADVTTPTFTLGAVSIRCKGSGSVNYSATANNTTGITYSLDAASIAGGNSINSSTGVVTYVSGWLGTSIITASAAGCGGPTSATHQAITNDAVTNPVFTLGSNSTRCQGATTVTYTATANYTTGITYSLDASSIAGGNTINSSTGQVTYAAGWNGTSIITASAAGCYGPRTNNHNVTITPSVGTPVFTLGATSFRCLGAATITYAATASNSTGITYSLDALSLTGGNSINASTGAVTYNLIWVGTSTITATAAGCNGPATATHTVTINLAVTTPVFSLGSNSTRCQGTGTVTYTASASNTSGITYSLDASSIAGGNSINSSNGSVIYASNWSGSSTITASAAGCNGPQTATHVVTITPSVGIPVFTIGSTSSRCQGTGTVTYTATATNNTGITYSLDATSISAGNSINASTGDVTYIAGWIGTSTISASATGCNGPVSTIHTATSTATIGWPVFALGATSTRCQGATTVTYTSTATNSTGITYSLDGASLTGGNTINASTGAVTYAAGWSGTSTITATAVGCNGPTTAMHIVTITPTVGTPVFTMGATSIRCQGVETITYTANATNSTGITYALDGASLSAGNTINSATGEVTYVATWSGTSTVIAMASGCNGPKVSTHVITVTPTVGTPVFTMGLQSVRTQGAATVTYTATASNNTGITYILDPASIAGGNTINAATGAVTYSAGWFGTTLITATATGCNGPTSSSHIATINPNLVQTPLYLSDPGQILDRIDPVSAGLTTTIQTPELAWNATTNISFSQNPVLCSDLIIKAQIISVQLYVTITSGTMPANPSITALLKYGSTTIINLINPVYNSSTGIISWSALLGADVTVPSGQAIVLQTTTAQSNVKFKIDYHSMTKPSRISLLPVSTFINITSFDVYSAPYPGGSIRTSGNINTTYYVRASVTTPFGYKDITGFTTTINPPGSTVSATCVDSTICTRIYQYAWTTNSTTGTYYLMGTAREGYENIIKNSDLLAFSVCAFCPPVALNDSAIGAGGAPLVVDVLANDYDPNNNINISTLSIFTQPNNGSGFVSNNKIVYLPNGSYAGKDTLTYKICDSTGLCGMGQVFFTINPFFVDPCSEATKSHVYFLPFAENEARIALDSSTNTALASNNIRTIISMKMPYPGMTIIWDEWEDGYEINALNPLQSTTKVWGDGNPYNGIAPGYANDIIPAGGSIVLDNTIPTNPRVISNIFYDGKDKITSSGQITVTQVSGEPSIIMVQCMKTNVSAVFDYGTSFTIPAGQNFNSQDFRYTALFIMASHDSTVVQIDKDNNGTLETTATINQGQVLHINGGVMSGATITANAPIGVDLHFGGNDSYSSRDVPIFPATWYSNTYFSPVPTTGSGTAIKDTNVVLLYNSLNRPLTINYSSGVPSSGSINLPAKTAVRFPLALSQTAAYKFVNPTGESFTAIEVCDSYTPGGGGNIGLEYDWSFNLIAQNRLTDFGTVAWAPGSYDGTRNDNPIWVTPTANTTIYVKYNGNVSGSSGLLSPCGMRYDVSYPLNVLNHKRLLDAADKDQSGLAVFTCDGTKLAAVYGEDASTAVQASPSWDVGSTIQPFCKQKLIFANDDYGRTMINQPVTIPVLINDFGFLAVVDPTSVTNTALLQAKHGSITINANGTILYTPNTGYVGKDTFEYNVCSTPTPIVCDVATVYVDISVCPAPFNENVIAGQVFLDKNRDGLNNDGRTGVAGTKVYLYTDGNCNTIINANELKDSVTVDASGTYQFITYPEKFVMDDFDGVGGVRTCANGSDGNSAWLSDWVDAGDPSVGFCNNGQTQANTHSEIYKDGAFSNALRLKNRNVSATRTINLSGAGYAFLSFSYRRKSATLTAGEDVIVQASSNGSTFGTVFTIAGNGTTDAAYVNIYNQDITAYAAATTYIRFLTNANVDDADTVYIDNVKVQFLRYPQCYIIRLDTATVPANYHTTSITQHAITATSSTTCLAPYDFGIAKNTVSISGTLFNDANGLIDNLINGTGTGTATGTPIYAYLIDTSGKVAYKLTLNSADGTYSFPAVDVLSNFTVQLSTLNVAIGSVSPADPALPGVWFVTGDSYGINNLAGVGIEITTPDGSIPVNTGIINITAVNFGMERLPNSDDKTVTYGMNTPGLKYAVPALSGTDPEDGVLGTGKTYKITSLPANAVLYYNNIVVTLNQVIPLFDPSLLKIDPDDPTVTTSFTYASMDAANKFDPSPATITINWSSILPVTLINFSGKLNGTKVDLNWITANEDNSDHFDVERSGDGLNFTRIGKVAAKGTTSNVNIYDLADPNPLKGLNYYRLKIIDRDGKYEYSKTIIIRIENNVELVTRVSPNPFTGKVDVYLTLTHNTMVDFRFIDINGRMVFSKSVKGLKGFNWFTINDLDKLPSAPYLLHIVTDDNTIVQKLIKQQ